MPRPDLTPDGNVYVDKRVQHSGTVGLQQVAPDHEAESIDQFPLELRRHMLAFLRQRNTGKKSNASQGPARSGCRSSAAAGARRTEGKAKR
jgi:hypothetical protein